MCHPRKYTFLQIAALGLAKQMVKRPKIRVIAKALGMSESAVEYHWSDRSKVENLFPCRNAK